MSTDTPGDSQSPSPQVPGVAPPGIAPGIHPDDLGKVEISLLEGMNAQAEIESRLDQAIQGTLRDAQSGLSFLTSIPELYVQDVLDIASKVVGDYEQRLDDNLRGAVFDILHGIDLLGIPLDLAARSSDYIAARELPDVGSLKRLKSEQEIQALFDQLQAGIIPTITPTQFAGALGGGVHVAPARPRAGTRYPTGVFPPGGVPGGAVGGVAPGGGGAGAGAGAGGGGGGGGAPTPTPNSLQGVRNLLAQTLTPWLLFQQAQAVTLGLVSGGVPGDLLDQLPQAARDAFNAELNRVCDELFAREAAGEITVDPEIGDLCGRSLPPGGPPEPVTPPITPPGPIVGLPTTPPGPTPPPTPPEAPSPQESPQVPPAAPPELPYCEDSTYKSQADATTAAGGAAPPCQPGAPPAKTPQDCLCDLLEALTGEAKPKPPTPPEAAEPLKRKPGEARKLSGEFPQVLSSDIAKLCKEAVERTGGFDTEQEHPLAHLWGLIRQDGNLNIPEWAGEIWGGETAVAFLMELGVVVADLVEAIARGLLPQECENQGILLQNLLIRSFAGMINFLSGGAFDDIMQPYVQESRVACPTGTLTPDQAELLFLANKIDQDTFQCLVRSNNQPDDFWQKIVEASRSKLGPDNLVTLWRRKLVDDQQLDIQLRELGYLDPFDVNQLKQATEQLPNISDIIRFMVRDTADTRLVKQFGMDTDFENKFTGRLKEWAEAQGLVPDAALHYWRAHWDIPSPSQLFEMLHRLPQTGKFGSREDILHDVETALEQQDILPFWIPRYLEISYRPITRIDVRRLYLQGILDREGMKNAFLDLGYADDKAEALTEFTANYAQRQFDNLPLSRELRRGNLGVEKYAQEMGRRNFSGELIQETIRRGEIELSIKANAACKKNIQRRFALGEFGFFELKDKLQELGLSGYQADQEAKRIQCETFSRPKEIGAGTLCDWFDAGLIDGNEYNRRLVRLGYAPADAAHLVERCGQKISDRQRKAAVKLAKQRQKEVEQAQQEEAKRQDQALKELAKLDKANARMAELRRKRQDKQVDVAAALAKKANVEVSEALRQVKATIADIQTTYKLKTDSAITIVADVVRALPKPGPLDITSRARNAAKVAITLESKA